MKLSQIGLRGAQKVTNVGLKISGAKFIKVTQAGEENGVRNIPLPFERCLATTFGPISIVLKMSKTHYNVVMCNLSL